MKFVLVLLAFAVIVCNFVNGIPVEQEQEHTIERANRMRRVTCDLLSVSTKFGALNHSACAAHCLALRRGFSGGRCIDGVCNCRK